RSFSELLKRWRAEGFEVSPHGYDHILWHDRAAGWTEPQARKELDRAFDVYRGIFEQEPMSFAAPGWQAGPGSWNALEQTRLLYHSDSRGISPYFPVINGHPLKTLEIPTTLPTWDEMLAWDGVNVENLVQKTQNELKADALNVWTIHAEVEGGLYFSRFKELIMRLKGEKVDWVFLPNLARELLKAPQQIPTHRTEQSELPGRAGTVTRQAHG